MNKWNVVQFPGIKSDKRKAGTRTNWLNRISERIQSNKAIQAVYAQRWILMFSAMGFLLGRATILNELAPFAAAYFAVISFLRRDLMLPVAASVLLGSLFAPSQAFLVIGGELLLFFLIHRGLSAYGKLDLSFTPLMVFVSVFMVNLFRVVIGPSFTWYSVLMMTTDAILSFMLTLVFIQAIPLLTHSKRTGQLKNEEILCLIILLASMMTGAVGWNLQGLSVDHILSRYLILVFALVGGAPLGASVGVITGLILSLADMGAVLQMSLLGFSGLLAGMLRDGRKPAVALGMLLGSSILSVYMDGSGDVMRSTWESSAAILLFLLTPKSLYLRIGRYIPGTQEHARSQHEYAKRIRDLTAERVSQFSEVFRQLARSFQQVSAREGTAGDGEMGHFMNAVAESTCASCFKREQCWDKKFMQTYQYMTEMMSSIEENPDLQPQDMPAHWSRTCAKTDAVLHVMKQQYGLHQHNIQWKRQIYDSRLLVAEQLSGVSQVMDDLAKEIKRENRAMHRQEDQIREALEQLGLSICGIEIVSLDAGQVEIEIIHAYTKGYDECRKIIAPLLSDILDEHITVLQEAPAHAKQGLTTVTFGSAKTYEVSTGVSYTAKGGHLLSGDSFSSLELGNGTFAVSLSDGMGNGERARQESSTALNILEQLLQSGMDERLAVKSVNSVLMLRSPEEMYATVDMALIDQYSAKTTFMKIGSTPSFIKRGKEVIPISASNLPIGIIQDIDIDLITVQLQAGDILIMMTDGVYDAPGHAVNKELWMKRLILELEDDTPQEMADALLDKVLREQQHQIHDDMTVVVSQVHHFLPEWSTLHMPGLQRMERPRTVS